MMAERYPFGEVSNAAGPSTLASDTPLFRSPVKALHFRPSPQKELVINACSLDSEQCILTASESDWLSEDAENDEVDMADDSTTTLSPSKRRLHRSADQQSRSPPPIFFGTPSKTEYDCRLKYQTQVRTRRLLRKDSIELTRRKSGGWDTRIRDNRVENNANGDETTDDQRNEEARKDELEPSPTIAKTHPSSSDSPVTDENIQASLQGADDANGAQMDNHSPEQDEPNQGGGLADGRIKDEGSLESIDPDETEEADWFGQKALIQSHRSSSPTPSLPSTPTKKDVGRAVQLSRRSASLAPSDADSSPGVALSLHSFVNRPSPLNFGMTSHSASPYTASPTLARSAQMSPEFDQENIVHEWRRSAGIQQQGEHGAVGESPRKVSVISTSVLSPTKVNVRQNLAAWAHARVKTPQSPEKKEWDQLRASMALSPTLGRETALNESERLIKLATQVKLPTSVTKTPLSTMNHQHTSTLNDQSSRLSPDRQPGSALRQSKLPIPASTSRLPRPFKLSVVKTPTRATNEPTRRDGRQAAIVANGRAQAAPAKSTTGSTYRKAVATSRDFDRSQSSSSVSSMHSSSPRHAFARTRLTAFSSPAKSAKPSAPIVRDARLIASRNGLSLAQLQASGPTEQSLTDTDKTEEGNNAIDAEESEQPNMDPPLLPQTSRSGSVGGARRLVLGAGAHDRSEATRVAPSAPARSMMDSPVSAAPARRLGVREVHTELVGERSRRNQARPMRRINDLVRKVDHSLSSSSVSLESSRPSSADAKRLHGPDRGATQQRSTHSERREPSVTKAPSHTDRIAAAAHQAHPAACESSSVASRAPGGVSMMPKPLPLSSAELSKLTSYHTRCNEASVIQLQFMLVRKQGEFRPPSPSSKFRKASGATAATAAAPNGVLSAKQKAERAVREAHDRRTRALQRAEGGGDAASRLPDSGSDVHHDTTRHRLGAGDDEVYVSPVRRISLKKAVRWHRALFLGPYEAHVSSAYDRSTAKKPCIVGAAELASALDRFGNVQQAGKPVGSPLVRRRKVLVTKIVYDDDDDEDES